MIFTEFNFLLFFITVFFLYWVLDQKGKKTLLLLSSCFFYGVWDWRFLGLLATAATIDFYVAKALDKVQSQKIRKSILLISVVSNLSILGFFKYFNFFVTSLVELGAQFNLHFSFSTLNIVLPLGISFFTFETLSYTIDVYKRKIQSEKSFINFSIFISFFPHLIAGPIVRGRDFLPQIDRPKEFEKIDFKYFILLFLIGFFKKACLSDQFSSIVDQYFSTPQDFDRKSSWLGVIFFSCQIYFDFSGYSDMAIATAGLLGYELTKNFHFPYFAKNISDFWRRWHISLSEWLRDYLYIPLGGNRTSDLLNYRNLFITMFLGGLWHGASWNFIIWGIFHGCSLILFRLYLKAKEYFKVQLAFPNVFAQLFTFYWVSVAWIFFRAEHTAVAMRIFRTFVLFEPQGPLKLRSNLIYLLPILVLVHFLLEKIELKKISDHIPKYLYPVFLGASFAMAFLLMPGRFRPFIYFEF